MESNNKTMYKNLEPAPGIDQKTLNKMAWRSCFLQASFNYERMQAAGWLYAMLPGLEKIHTDKEDLATSMEQNLEFFNIHPFLVTFAMGICLSLEQIKVEIPTIFDGSSWRHRRCAVLDDARANHRWHLLQYGNQRQHCRPDSVLGYF